MKLTPLKTAIFTAQLLLLLILANAQNDRGFIAFNIGPSFPTGNFASKDINNAKAGLASNGHQINIDGNFLISKYVGVSTLMLFNRNIFDLTPIINDVYGNKPVPWSASKTAILSKRKICKSVKKENEKKPSKLLFRRIPFGL